MTTTKYWTIENVQRQATVYQPDGVNLPIIFAFHGHGGTGTYFANKEFESYIPRAIVVYPTGLPTKSGGDPTGESSGWQHSVGEINPFTGIKDQDVKFFDAMLQTFEPNINPNLVFVHGWSNGGEFIYDVLWVIRDSIAAFCGASSILNTTDGKVPKPVIHIAGHSDPVVGFNAQLNAINKVKILDKCSINGIKWVVGDYGVIATKWTSSIRKPVVFLEYDGGHGYPDNVPSVIIKFFKTVIYSLTH